MKDSGISYDTLSQQAFNPRHAPKRLASGFRFAEGPLWHPNGYVLFSDIPANKIFQVYQNGVIHVLLHQSGSHCVFDKYLSDKVGSNGLAFDTNGDLVFCQHANHGIARLDKSKMVVQLCTSFNGRPFNSPNDLVVRSDGSIYFTDPPYGLKDEKLNPEVFQPYAGVYRFHNNTVTLVNTDFAFPNGICFSHDERYLFVSSNHPEEKVIRKYELSPNGEVLGEEVFAVVNADGIKCDPFDNLYAATERGVLMLSSYGKEIGLIPTPEPVTNIAFGGPRGNLLLITTYHGLYSVELKFDVPAKAAKPAGEKILRH